jgi:DNA invertase Pin-like site-specific DNA recombinase
MPPLKIAAAYIRVSTDDQLEYSPESQLKAIQTYAKREGFLIPEEYIFRDEGISGKSADKRPAFRLMIATAKEGKTPPFEAIFVWKWSRFTRNQEESLMYKKLLRKRGVDVVSISEPSTDSPFSSLIESIIAWMDEYYLINLAGEVRRGMKEKAVRGEAMGTAPYGYSVQNKTFVPNGDADTVRYIFKRYAGGAGMRELARELGDKGIRTRRGNLPDNRWISYILSNPTYIGKIRWSTEGHANYDRANYNGSNVLLVDGRHPPIIDPDLWRRVQDRLATRQTEPKNVGKQHPHIYMLRGLVRCGSCGATLAYVRATNSLQCCKYNRGQCSVSHHLDLDRADRAVIGYLEQLVKSGVFRFSPAPAPAERLSQDWGRLIRAEELRLSRARSALLDGVFTPEEYRDAKTDIEASLSRLRAAQAAETQTAPAYPDPAACRARLADVLQIIKDPARSALEKNKALRSVLDKIVYNKPERTFDFYFSREL